MLHQKQDLGLCHIPSVIWPEILRKSHSCVCSQTAHQSHTQNTLAGPVTASTTRETGKARGISALRHDIACALGASGCGCGGKCMHSNCSPVRKPGGQAASCCFSWRWLEQNGLSCDLKKWYNVSPQRHDITTFWHQDMASLGHDLALVCFWGQLKQVKLQTLVAQISGWKYPLCILS